MYTSRLQPGEKSEPRARSYAIDDGNFLNLLKTNNMKLLTWPDVQIVVKTMVENKINLSELNETDNYLIEKLTDVVFTEVRKKQLEEENLKNEGIVKRANPIYCDCSNPVIDKTVTKRTQYCFCGGVIKQ